MEPEILRQVSLSLKKATLFHGDFLLTQQNIKKNDLIFLDPPYTVSHNDNGFIKYNQKLFSLDDQERLSKLIDFIKRKGAFYVLTNAAHTTILEIFEKGDLLIPLQRANLIGGTKAIRGHTTEYIFTNFKNRSFMEEIKEQFLDMFTNPSNLRNLISTRTNQYLTESILPELVKDTNRMAMR